MLLRLAPVTEGPALRERGAEGKAGDLPCFSTRFLKMCSLLKPIITIFCTETTRSTAFLIQNSGQETQNQNLNWYNHYGKQYGGPSKN